MKNPNSTFTETARRVWKSAQLYIGFHRDQRGNQRAEAKVWPPKNGNAKSNRPFTALEIDHRGADKAGLCIPRYF